MGLLDFHSIYIKSISRSFKTLQLLGLQLMLKPCEIIYCMQSTRSAYLLSLCIYYNLYGLDIKMPKKFYKICPVLLASSAVVLGSVASTQLGQTANGLKALGPVS
jgi:hypothetical protein